MTDLFVVPAPNGAEGFVELARTKTGRLFRKQILPEGSFVHPADPNTSIEVNAALAESLRKNFEAGIGDIVQVPLVNDQNSHVEDPDRNIGEVVDLDYEPGKGVYVTIDARDKVRAEKLGKTLLGASALMHMNYTDTRTGEKVGPTLLHVAVTNRPYLTNLEEFREIVAASADMSGEEAPAILQLAKDPELSPATDKTVVEPEVKTEEAPMHDLDEILQTLKADHDIDVKALQEKVQEAEKSKNLVAAMSNVLETATGQKVTTATGPSIDEVGAAVVELAGEKVALAKAVAEQKAEIDKLKLSAAETEVEKLISTGHILPKQRDVMISLSVNDRTTFEALLPDSPLVSLSESGVTTHDKPEDEEVANEEALKAIARYEKLALSQQDSKKK